MQVPITVPNQVLLLHISYGAPHRILDPKVRSDIIEMGAVYLHLDACAVVGNICPVDVLKDVVKSLRGECEPLVYLTTVSEWQACKSTSSALGCENIYPKYVKSDGGLDVDELLLTVGGAAMSFVCSGRKHLDKNSSENMTEILRNLKRTPKVSCFDPTGVQYVLGASGPQDRQEPVSCCSGGNKIVGTQDCQEPRGPKPANYPIPEGHTTGFHTNERLACVPHPCPVCTPKEPEVRQGTMEPVNPAGPTNFTKAVGPTGPTEAVLTGFVGPTSSTTHFAGPTGSTNSESRGPIAGKSLLMVCVTDSQDSESNKLRKALDTYTIKQLADKGVHTILLNAEYMVPGNYSKDLIKGIEESFPVLLFTTAEKWAASMREGGTLEFENFYSTYCQRCNGKDISSADIHRWVTYETDKVKNYKPKGYQMK